MSMTAVPISIRLVFAPTAASNGKGEPSWRAKWCTRKNAPSAPSSSAATARSIDCNRASDADRVCDCGEAVQWPNDRKPIFFMVAMSRTARQNQAASRRHDWSHRDGTVGSNCVGRHRLQWQRLLARQRTLHLSEGVARDRSRGYLEAGSVHY